MDKYLCRKDVYDELEKAMKDRSHLTEKVITDKNGHQRKVLVRAGEDPKKQKTKKVEEPAEKKKSKHSTGDTVTLDGAKGDFKVSSIDKDGAYHVVSADGKKGYKVSENHITGNKGQNKAQKMADAEDKAFEEGQKNAQKKYGDMSIEELEKFIDEKSKAGKYTPEYKEAMDANDVLQQKKKDMAEKKNGADKSNNKENADPKTEYQNQLKEIREKKPSEYMRFMDQANKDYEQYKDAREKADIVARSPMFASFPGYATAKKEVEKWESKYPDFKENADKKMAIYKID